MKENSIPYIQNLDLQYLIARMVHKLNLDLSDAQERARKYKNFLILKCMYPDLNCVPTPEIDEVWHQHILHTQQYTNDCNQIFGKYLHHQPASGNPEESMKLQEAYTKTMRLYESTFQETYGYALDISRWYTARR